MDETLEIRLPDGKSRRFSVNPPFVIGWGFADNDAAAAISCMYRHGHSYYFKYDLVSGRVTGSITEYMPEEALPRWARDIPLN